MFGEATMRSHSDRSRVVVLLIDLCSRLRRNGALPHARNSANADGKKNLSPRRRKPRRKAGLVRHLITPEGQIFRDLKNGRARGSPVPWAAPALYKQAKGKTWRKATPPRRCLGHGGPITTLRHDAPDNPAHGMSAFLSRDIITNGSLSPMPSSPQAHQLILGYRRRWEATCWW